MVGSPIFEKTMTTFQFFVPARIWANAFDVRVSLLWRLESEFRTWSEVKATHEGEAGLRYQVALRNDKDLRLARRIFQEAEVSLRLLDDRMGTEFVCDEAVSVR
jgi:hypothetical protein